MMAGGKVTRRPASRREGVRGGALTWCTISLQTSLFGQEQTQNTTIMFLLHPSPLPQSPWYVLNDQEKLSLYLSSTSPPWKTVLSHPPIALWAPDVSKTHKEWEGKSLGLWKHIDSIM
ncbi:hypothetical protein CDAR_207391 [Caerostris darwini]|uniref:Uncharacterized protein n=1 Tax=Caerostris darwini TaxID=1538125 RepID=A0AAV4VH48_9ARAC|nr:hypothetical protein CDAR_207391 [Caerostris darwini]